VKSLHPTSQTPASAPSLANAHDWKPNGYNGRNSRKVGTLTLNVKKEFIQYGSNAADTDYVTCEPQTVDVMQHGDDYWLCAQFVGILTGTTRTYMVKIGEPAVAHLQTQSFGGVRDWLRCADTTLEITHPDLEIATVGKYDDGSAMLAVRRKVPAAHASPEPKRPSISDPASVWADYNIAIGRTPAAPAPAPQPAKQPLVPGEQQIEWVNREAESATPAPATEPRHTAEPWKRTAYKNENQIGYVSVISGADDSGVAEIDGEANARRIVACVNALAGLADPAAELARLRRCEAALQGIADLCNTPPRNRPANIEGHIRKIAGAALSSKEGN